MANVAWSLSIGGITQSLAAWQVKQLTIKRVNFDVAEMAVVFASDDIKAGPNFTYNSPVYLFRDSVLWFFGVITALPSYAGADSEYQRVVVSSAWWHLSRIVFQQYYVLRVPPAYTALSVSISSHVVLGQDAWGHPITADAQIALIASFAGVAAFPSLPALAQPFFQECRDITCADALKRMMALTPDCVVWQDFSSGTPVIYLRRRSALAVVTIDLNDKNLVEVVGDLTPRNDLLIAGVVLTFLTTAADVNGTQWQVETRQSAGATIGENVICATIDLSSQGTAGAETVPSGLASAYYSSRNVLHYQGTIRLKEQERSGILSVGQLLCLTNGRGEWAAMNAVVQSVTEDLFRGVTEVTIGPPEHLSPQDFVSAMAVFRNSTPASDFPNKKHNSDAGVPGDPNLPPNPAHPGGPSNPLGGLPPQPPKGSQSFSNNASGATATGPTKSTTLTLCDGSDIAVLTP